MIQKVAGMDGKVVEVEFGTPGQPSERVGDVADKAGRLLHYHGRFSLAKGDGTSWRRDADAVELPDEVLQLVEVGVSA